MISAAAGGPPIIEVIDVTKIYGSPAGNVAALGQTSLRVSMGEFVAVLGPSGCGKSTLLMIIAGLVQASSGSVRFRGEDVKVPVTDLGIVFQKDLLFDWRTVLQNVTLQGDIRGLKAGEVRSRALTLLRKVGLEDFVARYPWELSGGMRQRVGLCRALVHNASLLLLDEPFGALDALTRDQMNLDLQALWSEEKRTAVLVTHSIGEAIFLADRIIVMSPRPGQVVMDLGIELPRPRTLELQESGAFLEYKRVIRMKMEELGVLHGQANR